MNDVVEAPQHIAMVSGKPFLELPHDLFIPPDALEVFLETFEGPLDLLLYLIRKENVDILNIPMARITEQYMEYVDLMQGMRLELAAEYLLMAAILTEIKSRMLLPRSSEVTEEEDPRADLVRRLQEYERIKLAAEKVDELPRYDRDVFQTQLELPPLDKQRPLPEVSLRELLFAFKDILKRAELTAHHQIQREPLSIRERMMSIMQKISVDTYINFSDCFRMEEGRSGVVVTFIAILELIKQSVIDIIQTDLFAPIRIKSRISTEPL